MAETFALAPPRRPQKPLSERLRSTVLTHCGVRTLSCPFEPGGKLNGVGIPSELYCCTCGQARVWHDVAEAAAIVAGVEDAA